jgi:hypothetical protein
MDVQAVVPCNPRKGKKPFSATIKLKGASYLQSKRKYRRVTTRIAAFRVSRLPQRKALCAKACVFDTPTEDRSGRVDYSAKPPCQNRLKLSCVLYALRRQGGAKPTIPPVDSSGCEFLECPFYFQSRATL